MYATLDQLRSELGKPGMSAASAAYAAKMLHPVPESTSVDRAAFILERVKDKRVLEFGASGPMHDAIVKVALGVVGIDRESVFSEDGRSLVIGFDLDDVSQQELPRVPLAPEVLLCGELLEHLSNPGWFLTRLRRQYAGVPLIVTVPNAFSRVAMAHMKNGTENVNADHMCWFSWKTASTLLGRAGYTVREFVWYNGPPYVAEGLILVAD